MTEAPTWSRQPQRDRVAERMEERQDAENAVARLRVDRLHHRFAVGGQVGVRQHHALRIAGRTRREDDGREIVRLVPTEAQDQAFLNEAGNEEDARHRRHAFEGRDRLAEVVEIDELDAGARIDRQFVGEEPRRDDLLEARLLDDRAERLGSERVVEVHRDLAEHREAGVSS